MPNCSETSRGVVVAKFLILCCAVESKKAFPSGGTLLRGPVQKTFADFLPLVASVAHQAVNVDTCRIIWTPEFWIGPKHAQCGGDAALAFVDVPFASVNLILNRLNRNLTWASLV